MFKNINKKCARTLLLLVSCLFVFTISVYADVETVSGVYNYDASNRMLALVNESRVNAGLEPLVYDLALEDYAKQRAAELSVLNSHIRPDGSNVPYSENYSIGWGSADTAHTAFLNSSSHYANIMGSYSSMAAASFTCNGQVYWVQVFSYNSSGGNSNGLSGSGNETRQVITNNSNAAQYDNLNDSLTVKVGAYIKVSAAVNGEITSGTWTSDNTSIATVSSDGKISGVSPGVCLVTGKIAGQTRRIQVTVVTSGTAAQAQPSNNPPPPPPTSPPAPSETQPTSPPPTEVPSVSASLNTNPTNSLETSATISETSVSETTLSTSKTSTNVTSKKTEKTSTSEVETSKKASNTSSKQEKSSKKQESVVTKSLEAEKISPPSGLISGLRNFMREGTTGNENSDNILMYASIGGLVIVGGILVYSVIFRH